MYSLLRPGGMLVLEDVDFRGHFCHPPNEAFDAYVRLYRDAGRRKGADPDIGPRLPGLLMASGFESIELDVALPTFLKGPGKEIAVLTLRAIRKELLAGQLIGEENLDRLLNELDQFTRQYESILSMPRIIRVLGVRP